MPGIEPMTCAFLAWAPDALQTKLRGQVTSHRMAEHYYNPKVPGSILAVVRLSAYNSE